VSDNNINIVNYAQFELESCFRLEFQRL